MDNANPRQRPEKGMEDTTAPVQDDKGKYLFTSGLQPNSSDDSRSVQYNDEDRLAGFFKSPDNQQALREGRLVHIILARIPMPARI